MIFYDWLHVAGDADFRGDCPSETAEQVTFFNQLRKLYPNGLGKIAIHIRNEGNRTMYQTRREKYEGMVTGAADIVIPGKPCLVIELKRQDHTKSRLEKEQVEYLKAAQEAGAEVCVALGWKAAMEFIYDKIDKTNIL